MRHSRLLAALNGVRRFDHLHRRSCTTGPTTFPASLSTHPAHAFTPLFVTNTATGSSPGVLIPKTIVLNGETIVTTAPGLDERPTGRGTFEVTGILAPTIP